MITYKFISTGAFALALGSSLSACGGLPDQSGGTLQSGWNTTVTVQEPGDIKFVPSDEHVRLGVEYFNRGAFGSAQQSFKTGVEAAPKDVEAWIGLAASYDRLGRFDLADRAYDRAIALGGATPQVLNNQGYSQMLRGNIGSARAKFTQAIERDPGNVTAANNIKLLGASVASDESR